MRRLLVCLLVGGAVVLLGLVPGVRPWATGSQQAPDDTKTVTDSVGIRLRLIQPGSFMIGSTEGDDDEKPLHKVTITRPFYIGVHEVTQAQWQRVMGTNPAHFKGPTRPVERVSWRDAQAFCRKLSEKEGVRYRLPTEAEWEYACRAGTTTEWYWGDRWDETLAWVGPPTEGQTSPVGAGPPNPWGLYDTIGNVWEWCEDYHGMYGAAGQVDPNTTQGKRRVCRGGGTYSIWRYARAAARGNGMPDDRDYHLGLRVVRSANGK